MLKPQTVRCSIFAGEASVCRWKLTQRSVSVQHKETGILWNAWSWMWCLYHTPPFYTQGFMRKREWEDYQNWRLWMIFNQRAFFRYNWTDALINAKTETAYSRSTQAQAGQNPNVKKKWAQHTVKFKKWLANGGCLERGSQFTKDVTLLFTHSPWRASYFVILNWITHFIVAVVFLFFSEIKKNIKWGG